MANVKIFLVVILSLFTTGVASAEIKKTSPGELKSEQFTSPDICGGCHSTIYGQWSGSMHSNAQQDPFYLKLFELGSRETNGMIDTFCSRCHTPIGLVSGEIPPADGSKLSAIAERGVQCDFCHTISASAGIGNAQYVSSPGKLKRGPFKDAVSPYHETAYSELHTRAEFCGMCHNVNHPVNNLPLEATYTEWKEGPYSKEGVVCQDCHMTPGITKFQKNPGRAAAGGPEREHIYTHYFVGGNAFMTSYLGSQKHAQMAEERLRAAAKIEIEAPKEAKPGEEVRIKVKVSNIGCGHYLPTGLTEVRQVWLDVKAADAVGREIFRSGALDAEGSIDKNAVIYHTVLADAQGKPTEKVWLAESIISDKRIPPKGSSVEEYVFKVPQNIEGAISIDAKLRYRSAPQEFIDVLFGKGSVKVPIVEMTAAKAVIETPSKGICGPTIFLLALFLPALLAVFSKFFKC